MLIVDAPKPAGSDDAGAQDAMLVTLLDELPLAQAVRIAVALTGLPKNRMYERALSLKKPVPR